MRKLLLTTVCLLIGTLTVQAGSGIKTGRTKGGPKKVTSAKTSKTSVSQPSKTVKPPKNVRTTTSRSAEKPSQSATSSVPSTRLGETIVDGRARLKTPRVLREGFIVQSSKGRNFEAAVERSISDTGNLAALQGLGDLEARHQALLAEQQNLFSHTDIGQSVLLTTVSFPDRYGVMQSSGFTVTTIKIRHNGEEEIFGVIASHVLPDSFLTYAKSVHKKFDVQIIHNGKKIYLPAEVVQISPTSMLDISLVKFDRTGEELIKPLELSTEAVTKGEVLFSPGFTAGQPNEQMRTVQQSTFLSMRTDQNLSGNRQGFCGSPVLAADNSVKGIHTGTKEGNGKTADVSYATHAKFIRVLVDAYHNNGNALYDLVLDDHTLAKLNVDEYVSAFYIYDATGKQIRQMNLENTFSESKLRQAIQEAPNGVYLKLITRKAFWESNEKGESILKEDRTRNDKTKQHHWYNLQTKQIEPVRPAIIKM